MARAILVGRFLTGSFGALYSRVLPSVCPMHLMIFASMFHRTRIFLSFLFVATIVVIGAGRTFGQEANRGREDVSTLQVGRQLEAERRWHEAIQVYEKAMRQDANNNEIAMRLQTARAHFDVVRRYSDRSFIETVKGATPAAARTPGSCDASRGRDDERSRSPPPPP